MNSSRSNRSVNRSASRRKNYMVINIEHSEELEKQKEELRQINRAEKMILDTLKGLRYEKEKVENKMKDLREKIKKSRSSGGTRNRRRH